MTISNSLRGVLCASVSIAAAIATSSAVAQTAPPPSPTAANPEEVVVTARRVQESIRTLPMTAQAFGAQKLREENIQQTSDLMFHVTGIYLGGAFDQNNTTYILRGVGPAGQQGEFNPGVMSYFAEVPLPVNAQSQPAYDLANIQVLKGPQGTLFGKNTTGGAILVYPNTPNYSGYNGYIDGTFGSYNWREGQGAVNLPLVDDKLALRIAAHGAQRDGFVNNVTPGGPAQSDLNNFGVRVQLRWDPTAQISNNLMYDYYSSKTHGAGVAVVNCNVVQPANPPFPACNNTVNGALPPTPYNQPPLPPGVVGYGSYFETATPPGFMPLSTVQQWGITDRLEVHLTPELEFVNIAAYRQAQFNAFENQDGTALGLFTTEQLTNEEDFTEEPQLKGHSFDNKLDWIVGGFYAKTNPLAGNAFYNVIFGAPSPAGYPFYTRQSEAIYGNGTVHLDDLLKGLEFDAGLRYTWDQYHLCTAVQNNTGPVISVSPSQCASPATGQLGFTGSANGGNSAPTWSFGLNWKVSPDLFLYGVTRRGYRSGGVNGPTFSGALAPLQTYQPEIVTDFEFGERSTWHLGGWMGTLDMDYFHAQTDNVQQTAQRISTSFYNDLVGSPFLPAGSTLCPAYNPALPGPPGVPNNGGVNSPRDNPPGPGTGSSFDGNCNTLDDPIQTEVEFNAGTLISQGFEFQTTISPIHNLTFSGGGSLYKFTFSAGNNAIPAVLQPFYTVFLCPTAQNASSCLSVFYGVTATFTAGMHYVFPLKAEMGTLVFDADAYWSDHGAPISLFEQPAYDIVNLRLDWNHAMGGPVDLSIFAKNIADTHYAISSGNTVVPAATGVALGAIVLGEPRMIGGEIRYEFGQ